MTKKINKKFTILFLTVCFLFTLFPLSFIKAQGNISTSDLEYTSVEKFYQCCINTTTKKRSN